MTPLILAAKQKHQDLMEYLVVNAKANVNIQAEKVEFTVPCNTQYRGVQRVLGHPPHSSCG